MADDRKKPGANRLKMLIQRRLLLRLVIGGILISAILSGVVLTNERQRISRQVIEKANPGVERFNEQIEPLLGSPGMAEKAKLQSKLNILFIAASRLQETGHFVFIGVYNLQEEAVASVMEKDYPDVARVRKLVSSRRPSGPATSRPAAEIQTIGGTPHIYMSFPLINAEGEVAAYGKAVYAISASTVHQVKKEIVQAVLTVIAIVMGTTVLLYPLIALLINQLTSMAASLLEANLETLRVLGSAVAKRDSETDLHNYRVTIYAVRLAEALGQDARSIRGLIKGAFLHDVGKIGVSDRILLNPNRLTDAEYGMMKQHVQHGLDIIDSSVWLNDAAEVVGYHHEWYNGGGYPFGLRGARIPLNARIFAIADVFDALTSQRPYKSSYDLGKAIALMNDMRERHFDSELLDHFYRIAETLHRELAFEDEAVLQEELDAIIHKYFKDDITALFFKSVHRKKQDPIRRFGRLCRFRKPRLRKAKGGDPAPEGPRRYPI